ncbi:protein indeterminate-domain 7-like [Euphorbia lathyris]|uniref:protein indeterminate-domain 7-like n=1 Tax=Euphorbia lathyris TaxID=212925 RepID=UPI0033136F12
MSNITDEAGSFSSGNNIINNTAGEDKPAGNGNGDCSTTPQPPLKKKRNLPGNPDPNAEVIALSPTTLLATNRFVCEICNKGFQRDQNLQLHRRGHNLPWKLRQRTNNEIRKRVYVCPEPSCVHHNPVRALGDLTGIKKHFSRKHGEKKWKCEKCMKKYAVKSDWKAHAKTCGTKEYKCDCATIFSRRDSFITHRAFCDALITEEKKAHQGLLVPNNTPINNNFNHIINTKIPLLPSGTLSSTMSTSSSSCSSLQLTANSLSIFEGTHVHGHHLPGAGAGPGSMMSATALLQKAAQMGATTGSGSSSNLNKMAPISSFGTEYMNQMLLNGSTSNLGMFFNGVLEENNNNGLLVKKKRFFDGGSGDDDDVMIVDFFGVGESRDEEMEINSRIEGLSQFEQATVAMEKHIWDV